MAIQGNVLSSGADNGADNGADPGATSAQPESSRPVKTKAHAPHRLAVARQPELANLGFAADELLRVRSPPQLR